MHTTEESYPPSFSLDVGLQEKLWVLILVGPDQLGIMKKKVSFVKVGIFKILQLEKVL